MVARAYGTGDLSGLGFNQVWQRAEDRALPLFQRFRLRAGDRSGNQPRVLRPASGQSCQMPRTRGRLKLIQGIDKVHDGSLSTDTVEQAAEFLIDFVG